MSRLLLAIALILFLGDFLGYGCLITNCPRGGKRSKFGIADNPIKPCVSCGPGQSGQCFGPGICCGPFGCLLGTPDTIRCRREGFFHEREPCIAGTATCRKNTGRCAFEGICCNQESCHSDRECGLNEDNRRMLGESPVELYNLINYQAELNSEK